MNLLATLLAVILATTTPWVVRWLAPEAQRRSWWVAIPIAAITGGFLAWSASEMRGPSWPMALSMAIVGAICAQQVVIDLAVRRLPRLLSLTGFVFLLIGAAIHPAGTTSGFAGALWGAVFLTLITWVLVGLTRGSLGLGDLYLSPMLGALVGWFDPAMVLTMWLATAILGGLIALVGLASRRVERRTFIPYGPPMILGALVAVFVATTN